MNIQSILEKIDNINFFSDYTEFRLKLKINILDFKNTINKLNLRENTICLYNPKTLTCDVIGVVDINNIRYIDFDDLTFTMLNKGIDLQTSKVL